MDELKKKKGASLTVDLIIYLVIFLGAYLLFENILPKHFEMGPGGSSVAEYNFITPLAATIIILILVRVYSLTAFRSTVGMKLNKLEFDADASSLLKYDKRLYLCSIIVIIISMNSNFSSHCCGLINPIEMILGLVWIVLLIASICFAADSYKKRNEKIKIIQR